MPAQPQWFSRIPEILEVLRSLAAPYLDRQAVEELFGVGPRRARQLMAGLPGVRVGNAVGVERQALVQWLEGIGAGAAYGWERARRRRVAEVVEGLRRQAAARRVRLRVSEGGSGQGGRAGLPEGIRVGSGELVIAYGSPEELAERLFALARQMAEDWEGFVGRVASNDHMIK
jgi:hypothetical protein